MNVVTGSVLLAFAALVLGATGSLARYADGEIGPGFFPTLCAMLLGALGVLLVAIGLRDRVAQGNPLPGSAAAEPWRVALITASVVAFALLVKSAGLAVAVFATTWLATRAGALSHRSALVLSLSLAGCFTALFTLGLRLHVPALPVFLQR